MLKIYSLGIRYGQLPYLFRRINCWLFILVALGKITSLVLGRTHQSLLPHELGSSWTWTRWIKCCPSCSLNVPSPSRSILLHMFWTSSFNASLIFFALALVISPIGTFNGSLAWLRLVLGWSASIFSIISSKGLERAYWDKTFELWSANYNCRRNPTWIKNSNRIRIG